MEIKLDRRDIGTKFMGDISISYMTTVFGEDCRGFWTFGQEKLLSACGLKAVLWELGGSELESPDKARS